MVWFSSNAAIEVRTAGNETAGVQGIAPHPWTDNLVIAHASKSCFGSDRRRYHGDDNVSQAQRRVVAWVDTCSRDLFGLGGLYGRHLDFWQVEFPVATNGATPRNAVPFRVIMETILGGLGALIKKLFGRPLSTSGISEMWIGTLVAVTVIVIIITVAR